MVGRLDAYIAACELGITMASLALGWIGEPALAGLVEPPLSTLPPAFGPIAAHAVTAGFAFAIITALHMVIGELAPKGLALQRPGSIALWVARPIRLFYFVFGTAGIVPIEDVTKALIGSIEQEPGLDEVSGARPVGGEDNGSLLVSGLTRLEELEEVIGLREHVQTLGGLVMDRLGRLPSVGDDVHLASRRPRVEELDGNRVAFVRVLADQPD